MKCLWLNHLLYFFCKSIEFDEPYKVRSKRAEGPIMGLNLNKDLVYKSIYIHYPYTRQLYEVLNKFIHYANRVRERNGFNRNLSNASRNKEESELMIIAMPSEVYFDVDVPVEFYRVVFNDVLIIAQDFTAFIDEKIAQCEKLIKDNDEFNSDLVELI